MSKVVPRSSDSITSRSAFSASACSHNCLSSVITGLPLKTLAIDPDGIACAKLSSVPESRKSPSRWASSFSRTVLSADIALSIMLSYLLMSVQSGLVRFSDGVRDHLAPNRLRSSESEFASSVNIRFDSFRMSRFRSRQSGMP